MKPESTEGSLNKPIDESNKEGTEESVEESAEDPSAGQSDKVNFRSNATKITRSETFGGLLKTRPVAKTDRLMLHAMFGNAPPQFGILIPKRLAKRAVDRNTLKRLIRHACQDKLNNYQGKFLVRLSKPVSAVGHSDRAAWWAELQQLFGDLSRRAPSQR